MRLVAIAALVAAPSLASADPTPSYRLVEDGALGMDLPTDHGLLGDGRGMAAALAACEANPTPPTGSAVFMLEIGKPGRITAAHVHGAGKVDTCLGHALEQAAVVDKLAGPLILVGHLDLMEPGKSTFFPSPRISTTPALLDPHGTAWQLTVTRVAYTANRALDITQGLDAASGAIAACAPKRGKSAAAAQAIVWTDGQAPIARSGTPAYDSCVAHALGTLKLPAPESALWLQLEITPPAEPLAPRSDKAALSHPQALRDGLTTAVRSRKLDLLSCLDDHPKTSLTTLGITLHGTTADVHTVSTGNAEADACVRKKFHAIAIPSAVAADRLELDVTLDPVD